MQSQSAARHRATISSRSQTWAASPVEPGMPPDPVLGRRQLERELEADEAERRPRGCAPARPVPRPPAQCRPPATRPLPSSRPWRGPGAAGPVAQRRVDRSLGPPTPGRGDVLGGGEPAGGDRPCQQRMASSRQADIALVSNDVRADIGGNAGDHPDVDVDESGPQRRRVLVGLGQEAQHHPGSHLRHRRQQRPPERQHGPVVRRAPRTSAAVGWDQTPWPTPSAARRAAGARRRAAAAQALAASARAPGRREPGACRRAPPGGGRAPDSPPGPTDAPDRRPRSRCARPAARRAPATG